MFAEYARHQQEGASGKHLGLGRLPYGQRQNGGSGKRSDGNAFGEADHQDKDQNRHNTGRWGYDEEDPGGCGHPLAAMLEFGVKWKQVAGECRQGNCSKIKFRENAPASGDGHRQPDGNRTFCDITKQGCRTQSPADGPGHIGGPDITTALSSNIACCKQAGEHQAEGNRSEQIRVNRYHKILKRVSHESFFCLVFFKT